MIRRERSLHQQHYFHSLGDMEYKRGQSNRPKKNPLLLRKTQHRKPSKLPDHTITA